MNMNQAYSVAEIIERAHLASGRSAPFSDKLSDIAAELRTRRKQFLGTYVSMRQIMLFGPELDDEIAASLSDYLAARTLLYWKYQSDDAEYFCFRFYRLMIYALAGGKVRGECLDDILRLSDILISSREMFTIAMKSMLPEDMIGELFDFIETSDDIYLTSVTFPDAVLGGICMLLGVLPDVEFENEVEEG